MFSGDNVTAQVYRLVYTNGKSEGKNKVASYRGYLTEISPSELTDPTMYGRLYHFNSVYGADIQESDSLEIDGQKYSVQRVLNKR